MNNEQAHANSGKPAEREPDQTVLIECPAPVPGGAPAAPEPARKRQAFFIALAGSAIGKTFPLAGPTVIGRAADCGICLDDDGISREHARVEMDAQGQVWIADLDSTNGTFFLDGRRIGHQALQDGDKIRVGPETILKLSFHDGLEEDFYRHQYDSATKDALTGIYNKRYFLDQLKGDFAHARRQGSPLSLIAFDIDHFKQINDVHGHPAGDSILRELAAVVGRALRAGDWFARVGGEEFAIIERAADEPQVRKMAERIRQAVERHPFLWESGRIPVTVSLGVAVQRGADLESAEALIRMADECLYRAKQAGRNRVAGAPD